MLRRGDTTFTWFLFQNDLEGRPNGRLVVKEPGEVANDLEKVMTICACFRGDPKLLVAETPDKETIVQCHPESLNCSWTDG